MCNAEQLAATLAESFSDVRYNEKTKTGTANIPNIGMIEFHEARNEPAVIVNIKTPKRFKGSAETTLDFLAVLSTAWSNSD